MEPRRTKRMRGDFDNSVQWLSNMPPSILSTEHNASRFTDALQRRTGVPWIVKLVPPGRKNGGGFFIAPMPDRLDEEGRMAGADWDRLRRLFGALRAPTCRWYLFPDELAAAFNELGIPIFAGGTQPP
jgi:hypothetical protein